MSELRVVASSRPLLFSPLSSPLLYSLSSFMISLFSPQHSFIPCNSLYAILSVHREEPHSLVANDEKRGSGPVLLSLSLFLSLGYNTDAAERVECRFEVNNKKSRRRCLQHTLQQKPNLLSLFHSLTQTHPPYICSDYVSE